MTIYFRIFSIYINNILLKNNFNSNKCYNIHHYLNVKKLSPKYVMLKKSSQKYKSLQCFIILINEDFKYFIHIKFNPTSLQCLKNVVTPFSLLIFFPYILLIIFHHQHEHNVNDVSTFLNIRWFKLSCFKI